MLKRILVNASLFLGSFLIGLVLAEVYLSITGKYDRLVNGSSVASGTTLWTKAPNNTTFAQHPDLGYPVKEVIDRLGARNEGAPYVLSQTGPVVGVFGDSFTENTAVEEENTFIGLLNKYYGKPMFWNYGVNGYGAEQAFQRYMNVAGEYNFSDVIYVFCQNDLQNTFEVRLLEIANGPDGLVYANLYEGKDVSFSLTRYLGKLRLTYLVVDAYYQALTLLGFGGKPTKDDIVSDLEKGRKERTSDTFAGSVEKDFRSNSPSPEALAVAAKLKQVTTLWKQEVERHGSRFHVAVLPFGQDKAMINKLLTEEERKEFGVFFLQRPREVPMLAAYALQFQNDGHWNEIGNLAIVPNFISKFPSLKPSGDADFKPLMQAQLDKILALYSKYGVAPRTQGW